MHGRLCSIWSSDKTLLDFACQTTNQMLHMLVFWPRFYRLTSRKRDWILTTWGSNFGAHESWNSNESFSQGYGDSYNKADRHHDNIPLWQLPRHLQAIGGQRNIFFKRHLRAAVEEAGLLARWHLCYYLWRQCFYMLIKILPLQTCRPLQTIFKWHQCKRTGNGSKTA